MKQYFTFLITLAVFTSFGQNNNDSILPNYEGGYGIVHMGIGPSFEWVYTPAGLRLYNWDMDDTIYVGDPFIPDAKIFIDGYKAYIMGIPGYAEDSMITNGPVLLYDFSLSVGDTAYFEDNSGLSSPPYTPVTVLATSFDTINGQLRKRLFLSNNDEWLQGVGSLTHPLWPVMSHFETNYIMCSYTLDNYGLSGFYSHFEQLTDCSSILEIEENEMKDKEIVKVLDAIGREAEDRTNTILIYKYSDGTTRRVYRLKE